MIERQKRFWRNRPTNQPNQHTHTISNIKLLLNKTVSSLFFFNLNIPMYVCMYLERREHERACKCGVVVMEWSAIVLIDPMVEREGHGEREIENPK